MPRAGAVHPIIVSRRFAGTTDAADRGPERPGCRAGGDAGAGEQRRHADRALAAGKADRTRRAYQDDVAAFLRFVGKPLRQVKLADLVAYGETLDRLAPASRARKLGAVKSLASFGHRTGARSDQRDSYLPHQSAAPGV
ncbi:MAG: site-specific integrase [Acetobacteraceae bacterium]|nr:site-specific integrase [Acetobacteraceae bacterium]